MWYPKSRMGDMIWNDDNNNWLWWTLYRSLFYTHILYSPALSFQLIYHAACHTKCSEIISTQIVSYPPKKTWFIFGWLINSIKYIVYDSPHVLSELLRRKKVEWMKEEWEIDRKSSNANINRIKTAHILWYE